MSRLLAEADYGSDDDSVGFERGVVNRRASRASRNSRVSGDNSRRTSIASLMDSKNIDTLHDDVEGDEDDKKNTKLLILSFVLMIFVGLGNKVFQKLQTLPMYNYPNYLNLMTTFIYIPVSFAYIIPMARKGYIDEEQMNMSKRPFFVMGLLDAIAGIMQIFAATYLDGPLLILLSQAAIPVSMAISSYLIKAKYSYMQYLGAVVVAIGIAVVLLPSITGEGNVLWSVMMILSTIPMALSSVYKEIALGDQQLDPIFLNGWIAVFQFLFSVVLCVPASLASEPPVPVPELPENLWDGMRCYVGVNSQVCSATDDDSGACVSDDCHMATLFVTLYLVFNIGYNILIILIIKFGSASLLFMALTIMVPLGNIAFTLQFVPGHKPLQVTDIIGLVVICTGLGCYRFANSVIKARCGGTLCGVDVASTGEEGDELKEPLLNFDDTIKDLSATMDRDTETLNKLMNNERESGGMSLHAVE